MTTTTYTASIGACRDAHLTAERVLHHIVRADPGEEIEVWREDGAPCRIEADLDLGVLVLSCEDAILALSEPVDDATLDRWI
jgi:hypothetical protein